MATYRDPVEPGIFRKIKAGRVLPTLHVQYERDGQTRSESARTTDLRKARRLRAQRMDEQRRGEAGRPGEQLTIGTLLADLVRSYELNDRASLRTLRGHVRAWRDAGWAPRRTADLTLDAVERQQRRWQVAGLSNTTINHYSGALRRAFHLALRARAVSAVPYLPRLDRGKTRRGQYLPPREIVLLLEQLPTYVVELFDFAREYGIRRGQLSRTERRWIDLDRELITYPPEEVKARDAHVVPLLAGTHGLDQVRRLMAVAPPWCPYLFHGPRCAPARRPNKVYGCVGDFKKAWLAACRRAGLPVGRKAGGYIFHDTRNTAVSDLRQDKGFAEDQCMQITGHKTAHVFRHYKITDTVALKAELEAQLAARRQAALRPRTTTWRQR
jgi:hypothetical protein